jgi:FkbM family methyltransferase
MISEKIKNELFSHILEDDKIKIPEWTKKVKIDVGTSLNAPNSQKWLENDDELCVFGFEPNINNLQILNTGIHSWPIKLDLNKINKSFFYINCALSNTVEEDVDFYCTSEDSGTSSLYKPKGHNVDSITKITVIQLSDFFDLFPWEKIPYIEQLKIDAQSSDFNIIKGIKNYLSEKIVYLDVETTTNGQYENHETPQIMKEYIESEGFECIEWGVNARFVNKKYSDILNKINYIFLND